MSIVGFSGRRHPIHNVSRWIWQNRRGINAAGDQARRALFNTARSAYNRMRSAASNNQRHSSRSQRNPFVAKGGGPGGYLPRSKFRGRRKFRKRRFGGRRGGRRGKGLMYSLYKKLCTPMVYKSTFANAFGGSQGQRSWRFYELCGGSFINTLGAKHPSNFLYNTALGTSNTATLQDIGSNQFNLHIDKFIHDLRLQNRSNASMELKIYECVVRHDVSNNDFATTSGALQTLFNQSMDPPSGTGSSFIGAQDFNQAPGQAALPTGLTHVANHPTFTPFMSNQFCTFFKVLKIHNHIIGPNAIINKKFQLRPKKIKGAWINAGQGAYEWMRGWTKVLCFSWVGQPIDDGTTNNQSLAKTDLFLTAHVAVKYHFTPNNEHLVNVSYGNDINGYGNTFHINPADFTAVLPATETVETVPGYTSTGGTTTSTDQTTVQAP